MRSLCFFIACTLAVAAPALAADQSLVAKYGRPVTGGAAWTGTQVNGLRRDIDVILSGKVLRGAHVGLIAIAVDSGKELYGRNADDDFLPASNFKLLIGSAALQRLGSGFTFKTTVSSDGSNLYLHGGGDARLTAKDLDDAAARAAASGLTHVTGSVVTDATYFDAQRYGFGWSWDDLPYYYAAAVSALCLEENIVHVYVRPGPTVGSPAVVLVAPQTGAFTIRNDITTGAVGSKDTTDTTRNFEDWKTIALTGSYPLGASESDDLRPAVPDPVQYAGDVFLRALRAHGVAVDGGVQAGVTPPSAKEIWAHASEPMPQLLEDFWWPSDNLMGELFLKQLGAAKAGPPGTDDNGIAAVNGYLKSIGVDPATVAVDDGSGLSHYNHITPRALLAVLVSDWKSEQRDIVLDALPLSGVRGTLKSAYVGTPAEKNVFAKTGSISNTATISGFLRTRGHGTVAFSFMVDDWLGDTPQLAQLRAALFSRIITDGSSR